MLQFNFDAQKGETPASVAQKRALVAQILGTAKSPSNVGEGFSAIGDGIVANVLGGRAAEAEKAGQGSADDTFSTLVAALTGQGAPMPSYDHSSGEGAIPSSAGTPAVDTPWLTYANEGATRNLPLSGDLTSALSFLPELGVTMEVFSGGQPAAGEGARVGSERHDHGNAADVFFMKDGQRLDWSNPEHQPIFQEIVRRGKAAGITGFGAGDGYMQPGSMHLGFGPEAVWGAGGKGENAPDWLRSAFSGGPAQASPAPVQTAQGPDLAMLMEAAANPWLSDSQKSVINSMIAQEMQQQDPAYQQQLQAGQLGIEKSQLELEAMRNPTVEPQPLINTGDGRIFDPNKGEWIVAPNSGAPEAPKMFEIFDPETGLPYKATWNAETGEFERVGGVQAPSGTQLAVDPATGAVTFQQGVGLKPLTEAQSKDAVYSTRAAGALPLIDQYGAALVDPVQHAMGIDPTGVVRGQQSPEFQQAYQAGQEFLQAILRKDTGAAITAEETSQYGKVYLPQPGDSAEVLEQKRISRNRALAAIEAGMPPQAILQQEEALRRSGSARTPEPPAEVDPADIDALLELYR